MYLSPLLLIVTWCVAVVVTFLPGRADEASDDTGSLLAGSAPSPVRVVDVS
jgi:hypothetical protein